MDRALLDIICCPVSRSPLELLSERELSQLNQAISGLVRAVKTAAATGSGPPLDALLNAIPHGQPDEPALDRLIRAVLRSALEQRQARQANEVGVLAPVSLLPPGAPDQVRPTSSAHGRQVALHRREDAAPVHELARVPAARTSYAS